jgi:isochorismate synthase
MVESSIPLRCKEALAIGKTVGLCRLPDNKDIHFFESTSGVELKRIDLTKINGPSFAFAPYGSGDLAYIIIPENYISENSDVFDIPTCKWHISPQNQYATKEQYIEYVNGIIAAAKEETLLKTVAARCESLSVDHHFNPLELFYRLCKDYPQSYIYLFSDAESGTWCGATPELLLSCENNQIKTVALAGTKQASDETAWGEKELDEQHFVEVFVEDVFKQLKLFPLKKTTAQTIVAGNVKHLSSGYSWKADSETLGKKFHKILSHLNPTPAVSGLPPIDAAFYISVHERMERRFYSGFSGIVNGIHATKLYVTLRCMELNEGTITLYAGAGITVDSVAEKEWDETVKKMQTLKDKVLQP